DHRDTESLQAERARLAASLAAGGDLDRTITTDVAELERQADAASRQLEGLESDYARLEARRDETREVSAASAQQLVLAIEAHEQSSREREEHAGAYGSLDGLRDQADAKRRDVQDASQRARSRALDLDARQKQASTRHDTAKQQHDGLQALFVEKRSKKNQLIEDLERRAVRGAWSELGRVERRLDSERSRLDRLVAIAKGTMLIREAIESVRTEMLDELVAPVRDAFQDYLSFVTRGRYQSARLDVGMTPSEISTRNGQVLAFDQGSEGLRELTNALLRIAVAVDLGRKSPQVLILDDPCAHVSRDRSRRFSELVNRVVREHPVQIIVLSHRPTELLGLCGSTIDLANLRSDQATAAE
ncbi:MAG: hypothetical protein KDB53_15825, partial [Planctomycetes bacterium]|nr:hypothetical protein [Planctomycetota bacterium]